LRQVTILAERWRDRAVARGRARRGERANYGEIATVLAAVERGVPVLMDDGEGKTLAHARGLTVYGSDRDAFDAAVADARVRGA
jgi:predicted nucleic acid-binding protein